MPECKKNQSKFKNYLKILKVKKISDAYFFQASYRLGVVDGDGRQTFFTIFLYVINILLYVINH